ncbi:hypothetical protein WME99_38985 [Sorangium sp. So ce136]|uniref:hypothetical protein n=1 Tax=Sorangium sp. So ce136 TaxID=3133284 RepID=UPI003F0658FC
MLADENSSLDLDSLVGQRFKHGSAVLELSSVLRAGEDSIVYEVLDTQTGQSDHVLNVYRGKLSEEELKENQAAYLQCAEIIGDGFLEGDFSASANGQPGFREERSAQSRRAVTPFRLRTRRPAG